MNEEQNVPFTSVRQMHVRERERERLTETQFSHNFPFSIVLPVSVFRLEANTVCVFALFLHVS
jgi:hypothetical protein